MNKLKSICKGIYAMSFLAMFNILFILIVDIIANKGMVKVFFFQRNLFATIAGFIILTATEIFCLER